MAKQNSLSNNINLVSVAQCLSLKESNNIFVVSRDFKVHASFRCIEFIVENYEHEKKFIIRIANKGKDMDVFNRFFQSNQQYKIFLPSSVTEKDGHCEFTFLSQEASYNSEISWAYDPIYYEARLIVKDFKYIFKTSKEVG